MNVPLHVFAARLCQATDLSSSADIAIFFHHLEYVLVISKHIYRRIVDLLQYYRGKAVKTSSPWLRTANHFERISIPQESPKMSAVLKKHIMSGTLESDATQDDGTSSVGEIGHKHEEENTKMQDVARNLVELAADDYRGLLDIISKNPFILQERKTYELLVKAFDSQVVGEADIAKRYVNHALFLMYYRLFGHDDVELFFRRRVSIHFHLSY
jgi:Cdc37 Hsp90 binding domain